MILLIGSLIAIPFFLNLSQAAGYSMFQEVSQRHGAVMTRQPTMGLLAISLLLAFLLFFPRKPSERYIFSLALVITPLIVLNQQVLTGRTLQNAHYHWYFHTPLAIIFLCVIFFHWLSLKKWQLFQKVSVVFIVTLSIYSAIVVQVGSYQANEIEAVAQQRYVPVLQWFNQNLQKDQTVFTDETLSSLIVIYTPFNVFYHPSAKFSLAGSKERLLDTLFLFYRLDGLKENETEEVFFKDRVQISSAIYGIHYREAKGDYGAIPDEILKSLAGQYRTSLSVPLPQFLKGLFGKYPVDHLVWDKKSHPQWSLDQYPFLRQVAQINDFIVYKLD